MHINSLPTTTINLQIQPRDTHKSPPKTFLGNSKVSHLLQLGLRFVKVRALQALLETQTHAHIRSLLQFESEHQLTQCFSFQSQNVICKEAGTLHLLWWKRKMSQQSCPSLLLYIWRMTCIHSTWQNVPWCAWRKKKTSNPKYLGFCFRRARRSIDPHSYATSFVVFPSKGIATSTKEEICNVEMAEELRDAAVLIASENPQTMLQ